MKYSSHIERALSRAKNQGYTDIDKAIADYSNMTGRTLKETVSAYGTSYSWTDKTPNPDLKPGDTLPNTALVISTNGVIVLARTEVDFVTWALDADGHCSNGHYFGEGLELAVEDYNRRTARGY
ncbi:MAG: hypothetical protein PVI43_00510 [Candidatus Bathyarchaeota archaeon]|jgi:hypothetical protein